LDGFAQLLDMEGVMCDSDKFSFAFSLNRMPKEQRRMISERMNNEMGQLKEIMDERKGIAGITGISAEVTRFTRNLYRFFKLFRRKGDFPDPFENPIDFRSLPYLSDILSDKEILNIVGEFYFKRGYYEEALPILLTLEKSNEDGALFWEKIGYCYNALKDMNNALIWYRKAELINPDSLWLIKKLALTNRILNRSLEAAEYYTKALEKDPDNFKLLISAGNCFLEADRIDEALQKYYHADYIKPDSLSAKRAIAWAELLNGRIEKSLDAYNRIIASGEATSNDYLNAGHACFLAGNLKEAVNHYLKCARDKNYGIRQLEKSFAEDIPVLEKAGGNINILNIILDKVRYDA
ncbi:MAG: tetratricopeptide repeat protein, partial [Muribaculaceae bacterium]|nr:tetratricopeptide repeat protein [Muribaculaceae bacterium]